VKAARSLKARALQMLAQRDQSRVEMRVKLLRHARRAPVDADSEPGPGEAGEPGEPGHSADPAAEVEALLDWLEAHRHLSAERFVESRVHARLSRFGNLRIHSELARHGLNPSAEIERSLAATELERAREVRDRRFADLPHDAAERARQARFLAGRGFSADVIHRALRPVSR